MLTKEQMLESLKLASEMSEHFYSLPIVLLVSDDKDGQKLVELADEARVRYDVLNVRGNEYIPHRICVTTVREAEYRIDTFGVRGEKVSDSLAYSLEHSKEVFEEALEMIYPVWDCMLITAMRKRGNVTVNPFVEDSNGMDSEGEKD